MHLEARSRVPGHDCAPGRDGQLTLTPLRMPLRYKPGPPLSRTALRHNVHAKGELSAVASWSTIPLASHSTEGAGEPAHEGRQVGVEPVEPMRRNHNHIAAADVYCHPQHERWTYRRRRRSRRRAGRLARFSVRRTDRVGVPWQGRHVVVRCEVSLSKRGNGAEPVGPMERGDSHRVTARHRPTGVPVSPRRDDLLGGGVVLCGGGARLREECVVVRRVGWDATRSPQGRVLAAPGGGPLESHRYNSLTGSAHLLDARVDAAEKPFEDVVAGQTPGAGRVRQRFVGSAGSAKSKEVLRLRVGDAVR